jgi:hypothetical protein
MGRELTPAELHELLAPYALDAVDADERAQVEEWLVRSPDARAEVAELRETAAYLAHGGADAPPGLWQRISGALVEEPPGLVLPMEPARGRTFERGTIQRREGAAKRTLALRVGAGIAAASAIAASITFVVLDDQMSEQEQRLEALAETVKRRGTDGAAAAAAVDPASSTLELASADGHWHATVVSMPDGTGYLVRSNLPELPEGRVYQLWAMTGSHDDPKPVSAGVLGRTFDVAAFRGPAETIGFAVTDEAAPGVSRSHRRAVVAGEM